MLALVQYLALPVRQAVQWVQRIQWHLVDPVHHDHQTDQPDPWVRRLLSAQELPVYLDLPPDQTHQSVQADQLDLQSRWAQVNLKTTSFDQHNFNKNNPSITRYYSDAYVYNNFMQWLLCCLLFVAGVVINGIIITPVSVVNAVTIAANQQQENICIKTQTQLSANVVLWCQLDAWVSEWVTEFLIKLFDDDDDGFNDTSTQFRSLAPNLTRKAGTESPIVKESQRYVNLANTI